MGNSMEKPLLAYTAHDGGEGWCVVFATSGAAARRYAAGEMNCEFSEVEYCRRAKEFDRFAPGPVPMTALIESGWHTYCLDCGARIDQFTGRPVITENLAFCSPWCWLDHLVEIGSAKAEILTAIRLLRLRFPNGTKFTGYHSCEYRDRRTTQHVPVVEFRFPGGLRSARWESDIDRLTILQCDKAAWDAWRDAGYPAGATPDAGGADART